jgi:hypothetical protein
MRAQVSRRLARQDKGRVSPLPRCGEDVPLSDLPAPPFNLGFLTVLHEPNGYVGGYLVTNLWGRPLEFRLSSAVQPNRVQQILYAGTLEPYVCAELIGKTLVDKTATPIRLLVTDTEKVLEVRRKLDVPLAWIAPEGLAEPIQPAGLPIRGRIHGHAAFPDDAPAIIEVLDRVAGLLDLAEPFGRIREALAEARKLGLARAA